MYNILFVWCNHLVSFIADKKDAETSLRSIEVAEQLKIRRETTFYVTVFRMGAHCGAGDLTLSICVLRST